METQAQSNETDVTSGAARALLEGKWTEERAALEDEIGAARFMARSGLMIPDAWRKDEDDPRSQAFDEVRAVEFRAKLVAFLDAAKPLEDERYGRGGMSTERMLELNNTIITAGTKIEGCRKLLHGLIRKESSPGV